jgi:outer membrane protein OmpA-like peptidoglycan-associated protein
MNTRMRAMKFMQTPITLALAAVVLAACASAPSMPDGAAEVRGRLTALQANPELATRAPVAITAADVAVRTAEQPESDARLGAHRVFLADRKVETARAQAQTRLAEDQRAGLTDAREKARLDARTREADAARRQAEAATAQAEAARVQAESARSQAEAALSQASAARADSVQQRLATESAQQEAARLQQQLDALQAKATERGMVVTLGDVLFTSGEASLREGAAGNLAGLVAFLNEYPDRTLLIEGYTDSVGSDDMNQGLSQRRAEAVRSYLLGQGIAGARLNAQGRGETAPVASNESATGRQQNRRVEILIVEPAGTVR